MFGRGVYVFTLSYKLYSMDVYYKHYDEGCVIYEGKIDGPSVGYTWMACSTEKRIRKEFKKLAKKYWKELKKKLC